MLVWKMIATRMRALLSTTRILPAGEVRTESSVYQLVSLCRKYGSREVPQTRGGSCLGGVGRGEKRGREISAREFKMVVVACVPAATTNAAVALPPNAFGASAPRKRIEDGVM